MYSLVVDVISFFGTELGDTVVMALCWTISVRYKQIADEVKSKLKRPFAAVIWRRIQEDYRNVTKVFVFLNETISGVVFLTFGRNFYHVITSIYEISQ